jgi:hypothetical protein
MALGSFDCIYQSLPRFVRLVDLTDALLLRRIGKSHDGRLKQALFYITRAKSEIEQSLKSPESFSPYSFVLAEEATLLWLAGRRNEACQAAQNGKSTGTLFFEDFVHTFCEVGPSSCADVVGLEVGADGGAQGQHEQTLPVPVVEPPKILAIAPKTSDIEEVDGLRHERKYVLCVQDSLINLGNRLVVVVGCQLLALLTGRELLVVWENHAAKEWGNMFEGPSLSYDEALSRYLDSSKEPWQNVEDVMDNLEFWADYDGQTHLDDFVCSHLSVKFTKPFLAVRGNVNFIPLLMKNPHYITYITDNFPHDDVFGYVARQIIRPKANILKHIDDFYEKNMQGYDSVVGVHLRMGMDSGDWQWEMLLQSDDGEAQKKVAVEYTFECLVRTISNHVTAHGATQILVFVATDDVVTQARVLQSLNNGKLHHDFQHKGVIVEGVAFQPEEAILRSSLRDIQLALVDLFLLSKCDVVVRGGIGALSFFSSFAASYGNRPSVYLLECEGKLQCQHVETGSQPRMGTLPKHINVNGLTCRPGEPRDERQDQDLHNLGKAERGNLSYSYTNTLSGMLSKEHLLYPVCEES